MLNTVALILGGLFMPSTVLKRTFFCWLQFIALAISLLAPEPAYAVDWRADLLLMDPTFSNVGDTIGYTFTIINHGPPATYRISGTSRFTACNTGDAPLPTGVTSCSSTYIIGAADIGQDINETALIEVNNGGDQMLTATATYVPQPRITSVSPSHGPTQGGDQVRISGEYLNNIWDVTVDGAPADFFQDPVVVSARGAVPPSPRWIVVMPAHAAGAATIAVTNGYGTATATYTYDPPPVTSIVRLSPSKGPEAGGNSVAIQGVNLYTATSITVDGVPVTRPNIPYIPIPCLNIPCYDILPITMPPHATGPAVITVTGPGGSASMTYTYDGDRPPSIAALSPSQGSAAGGNTVEISGNYLFEVESITVGGRPVSFSQLPFSGNGPGPESPHWSITMPAGNPGFTQIGVTTSYGFTSRTYAYEGLPLPTITNVSPSHGPARGGTSLTLEGASLNYVTSITVDGVSVPVEPRISVPIDPSTPCNGSCPVPPQQVGLTTPPHAAGPVQIVVLTADGSATTTFTYDPAPPVIFSLSFSSGLPAGGNAVSIQGEYLADATSVTVDGSAVPFTHGPLVCYPYPGGSCTETLSITMPPHAVGGVEIVVTTPNGSSSAWYSYEIVPPPVIHSMTPAHGPGIPGFYVEISGEKLSRTTSVTVDGVAQSFFLQDDNRIGLSLPAHAAGSATIEITTPGGTASTTYTFDAVLPTLTSVSPASGPASGGTLVTLTGKYFDFATAVTVDGASVPFELVTPVCPTTPGELPTCDRPLTISMPGHAQGTVQISVVLPDGSVSGTFTYTDAGISSFTPMAGPVSGGSEVTIYGSGFTGATAVSFGGVNATSLTVIDDHTITAIAPAHAVDSVNISVVTPGQTYTSGNFFSFVAAPSISSIAPASGPSSGGNQVEIYGNNLEMAIDVQVDGMSYGFSLTSGANPYLTILTMPQHSPGSATIKVVSYGGSASATYSYLSAAPEVTSVIPNSGPATGNTRVTIKGQNLSAVTSVSFGGVAATALELVDATTLTALTPPHAPGALDVVVTSADGTAQLSAAFTYQSIATTISLSASTSSPFIGQAVTLTATVLPATATGTITIRDGSSELCTGIAVSAGAAECQVAFGKAGTHVLTAHFSASGEYAASDSSPLQVAVTDQVTKTVQTIGRFLSQRTNQILTNEPDAGRQINRLNAAKGAGSSASPPGTTATMAAPASRSGAGISSTSASRVALVPGARGEGGFTRDVSPMATTEETGTAGSLPIRMTGSDEGPMRLGFATSLSDMQRVAAEARQRRVAASGIGREGAGDPGPQFSPFDIWFEGQFSRFNDDRHNAGIDGHFGLYTIGADYVVNPSLLVGVLVQFDTTSQTSKGDQTKVDGVGWMAGPYATMRLGENVFWQIRGAWGTSSNDVSPYQTYTDNFDTTRWLASTTLSGTWDYYDWSFRPTASVGYMQDTSGRYEDRFGAVIPEVRSRLGQAKFGPEIGYRFAGTDGAVIEPRAAIQAIWNFSGSTTADTLGTIDGVQAGPTGVRGRVELGLRSSTPSGLGIDISASYDGIGSDDYNDVAGRAAITLPMH